MPNSRKKPKRLPPIRALGAGVAPTIVNAYLLLLAGKDLGRKHLYGPGAALVVLATEEAIKALSLFTLGQMKPFKPEHHTALKTILKNHEFRHAIGRTSAISLHSMLWRMNLLRRLERRYPNGYQKQDPAYLKASARGYKKLTEDIESLKDPKRPHVRKLKEAMDWWDSAEALKERGLYVDWLENRWWKPANVSRDDFRTALRFAEEFVRIALVGLTNYSTLNDQERVEWKALSMDAPGAMEAFVSLVESNTLR
jgi:AbiV family abortive infection protein